MINFLQNHTHKTKNNININKDSPPKQQKYTNMRHKSNTKRGHGHTNYTKNTKYYKISTRYHKYD